MSNAIRSARGDHVDFELLAIKAQLAAKPVPKPVEQRRVAIEEREGTRPVESAAVTELLKAAEAEKTAPKRK